MLQPAFGSFGSDSMWEMPRAVGGNVGGGTSGAVSAFTSVFAALTTVIAPTIVTIGALGKTDSIQTSKVGFINHHSSSTQRAALLLPT